MKKNILLKIKNYINVNKLENTRNLLIFNKILSVIKSCININQLENTKKWSNEISYLNKIPKEYLYKISRAYDAKKMQIENGLAAKYN